MKTEKVETGIYKHDVVTLESAADIASVIKAGLAETLAMKRPSVWLDAIEQRANWSLTRTLSVICAFQAITKARMTTATSTSTTLNPDSLLRHFQIIMISLSTQKP